MEKKPNKLPGFLNGLPSRSYMLMMAAGLYLAYTGYQLCHGIMTGESSGIGFLIGGIAFVLIGAVMVLVGIYGISVNGKQEAEESAEEDGPDGDDPDGDDLDGADSIDITGSEETGTVVYQGEAEDCSVEEK